jgi:Domain of Unknown Function (DUF928)
MTEMNLLSKLAKLTFAIVCVLLCLKLIPIQIANSLILAKSPSTKKPANRSTSQTTNAPIPPDPTPQPSPRDQDGPGGRPACKDIQPTLTPIVPATSQSDGNVLLSGKTTKNHPTFWFYIPYKSIDIQSATFTLQDRKKEKPAFEKNINIASTPALISISLPLTAPALENGKLYDLRLSTSVFCPPDRQLDTGFVEAQVIKENISQNLDNQLKRATPQQQASIYAKAGFWYDALTTSAELKRTNPNDSNLAQLLREYGLTNFVDIPVRKCCQISE